MISLLELADAVVSEINAPVTVDSFTEWRLPFTAVRSNVPRFDASNLADLQVTVRVKDRRTERIARGKMRDTMRIYVAIQKKQTSDDNSESDPLIKLGEQIQAYFDQKIPLAALPWIVCEGSSFGSDTDSTYLNVKNQDGLLLYTGLIMLTFGATRRGQA